MDSQPNRVLWILDYFPRPHDMTTGLWGLQTVLALQRQDWEVVVLCPTPWIPRWLAWTPILRNWAGVPREISLGGIPVFYPRCPHYPHRLVTRHLYHNFPFLDSALVWRWCGPAVEQILRRYPFQIIHANFIFPSGYIGSEIKRKYGVPLIVHERSLQRLMAARDHRGRRKLYVRVVKDADAVITINSKMANIIRAITGSNGHTNIAHATSNRGHAYNSNLPTPGSLGVNVVHAAGADAAFRHDAQALSRQYLGKRIALSVGSLIERKGHEYLIRAIGMVRREVPNVHCIIIGSGVRMKHLRRLINELGLKDTVELWGQRPHAEVLRTMRWCDVFVLPSWNEPGGTVYGEAMAFAKPIIACAGEGIGEVAQDGLHGLFVRPRDVGSLAGALARILRDEALALRLGAAAQALAEEKLTYAAVATRIIAIYRRVFDNYRAQR